jgi:hypothetical protein
MGFRWLDDPPEAFGRMHDRKSWAIYGQLYKLSSRFQMEIENWMKANASWQDRTGNARQGLAVDVIPAPTKITLVLTIGRHPNGGFLSYGKHLELSMGGEYAIVGPAVDHWAPKVFEAARSLVR